MGLIDKLRKRLKTVRGNIRAGEREREQSAEKSEQLRKALDAEKAKRERIAKATADRRESEKEIKQRLEEAKKAQQQGPKPGTGPRCGATSVVERVVIPFVRSKTSAPVTSRLRPPSDPLSIANPGSDHNSGNSCNDAVDFGIANAFTIAGQLRAHMGASGPHVDYEAFYVTYSGVRFRVQIIAGTHGTGPHLHVGVKRA